MTLENASIFRGVITIYFIYVRKIAIFTNKNVDICTYTILKLKKNLNIVRKKIFIKKKKI